MFKFIKQAVLCTIFERELYYERTKKSLESSNNKPVTYHLPYSQRTGGEKKEETVFELEDFSNKKETFKFRVVKNMIDSEGN